MNTQIKRTSMLASFAVALAATVTVHAQIYHGSRVCSLAGQGGAVRPELQPIPNPAFQPAERSGTI